MESELARNRSDRQLVQQIVEPEPATADS